MALAHPNASGITLACKVNWRFARLIGAPHPTTLRAFGRDGREGPWANLAGAHFEGALLSSSDIERLCENPTIDLEVRKFELGCRSSK